MSISIIFCFRDRELSRVQRSLNSLQNQTNKNFATIFVDYGSEKELASKVKKEVEQHENAQYFYCHSEGMPWNRSHALNIGIRKAETDFVFTADIDLLFHPSFIDHLYTLSRESEAAFMPCFLLPESFSDWTNFYLQDSFPRTNEYGLGLSLIKTSLLNEIHGYDEFYNFWGREDNDLHKRLSLKGVNPVFKDSPCLLYHQWHPLSQSSHKIFPKYWEHYMRHYLIQTESILRNKNGWGFLLSESDRPSLKILFDNTAKKLAFNQINNDGLLFLDTIIHQDFHQHSEVCYHISVNNIDDYFKSRTIRILAWINNILKKTSSPIRTNSKNRSLYYSVYEVRDKLIHFIQNHRNQIKDYYLNISSEKNKITFVIIKK